MVDYEKLSEEQHRTMKRVAFFAVVVSTVAVMAAVVTVPMIYSYAQTLHSHMMTELDFCKVRYFDSMVLLDWMLVYVDH